MPAPRTIVLAGGSLASRSSCAVVSGQAWCSPWYCFSASTNWARRACDSCRWTAGRAWASCISRFTIRAPAAMMASSMMARMVALFIGGSRAACGRGPDRRRPSSRFVVSRSEGQLAGLVVEHAALVADVLARPHAVLVRQAQADLHLPGAGDGAVLQQAFAVHAAPQVAEGLAPDLHQFQVAGPAVVEQAVAQARGQAGIEHGLAPAAVRRAPGEEPRQQGVDLGIVEAAQIGHVVVDDLQPRPALLFGPGDEGAVTRRLAQLGIGGDEGQGAGGHAFGLDD